MKSTTFSERLAIALLDPQFGMTQLALAKAVGYKNQSAIGNILNDPQRFGSSKTYQIAQALNVDPLWLADGVGQMRPQVKPNPPAAHETPHSYGPLRMDHLPEVAELFQQLSHHSQAEVMGEIVKRLYQEQGGIPKGVDPLAGTGAIAKTIIYGAREDDKAGQERVSPQGSGHSTSPRTPTGGRKTR